MPIRYNSAISGWLASFVLLVLGSTTVLIIVKSVWVGFLVNVPLIVWLVHMGFNTYYILDHGVLHITCGLFYKENFLIADITQIRATNNPLSSPALSMERLEIQFKSKQSIMISPKAKNDFIKELVQQNPSIKVKM